jgi:hypothetical protein
VKSKVRYLNATIDGKTYTYSRVGVAAFEGSPRKIVPIGPKPPKPPKPPTVSKAKITKLREQEWVESRLTKSADRCAYVVGKVAGKPCFCQHDAVENGYCEIHTVRQVI